MKPSERLQVAERPDEGRRGVLPKVFLPEKIRADSPRLLQFSLRSLCAACVLLLQLAWCCCGAELSVKVADKEPPKELDASIRAILQSKAVQVLNGDKTVYEFWLSSEVPLRSKPASPPKALDAIKEATLLGAVSVPATRRDYRDDELAAGIYTMRFALQPQDGDHLGTAEYSYFAVLVSAKIDTKPDGITEFKALVKASAKTASGDHPVILSLRPAASDDGDPLKLNEPAPEHKSVRLKVPAKVSDEKTSLTFEIVCEGKAKK